MRCIALFRGINVGKAKRVSMADLRSLVEALGYGGAGTLLNSGNVVFEANRPNARKVAAAIEAALLDHCGFTASVIVVPAPELAAIIEANPLSQAEADPSKFLVAFVAETKVLSLAKPLLKQNWGTEVIAIGDKAAYLWCAGGIHDSGLMRAFARATSQATTTRNWTTVLKLRAACA